MNSLFKSLLILTLGPLLMSCILCHIGAYQPNCGQRPRDIRINRIIGGVNTFYGEVPWQVLLHVKVNNVIMQCGAVLINQNWILTAAHCIDVNGGHCLQIEALFGKHSFSTGDIETQASDNLKNNSYIAKRMPFIKGLANQNERQFLSRNASKIIIHELFNSKTLENDIALIRLNQSITNEDNIQPICLPKLMEDFSGQSGYISGFGVLEYGIQLIKTSKI